MTQELVRERLNNYLNEIGVSQKFICLKCDIPTDVLSRFKTGKKELFKESLEALDDYLIQHNA